MSNVYALIKGVDGNGNEKSDVEHMVYGNFHNDIGPGIDKWIRENKGKKYIYTESHKLAMIIDGDNIIQLGNSPDGNGQYDMDVLVLINAYQFHVMTKGFVTHDTTVPTGITYTPAKIFVSGDITVNDKIIFTSDNK